MLQKEIDALNEIEKKFIDLMVDKMTLEMVLKAFIKAAEDTQMYDKVGDTYYNAKKLMAKYFHEKNIYSDDYEIKD